jgi:hypothetical protein
MIANLTPHPINLPGLTIPASGQIARVSVSLAPAGGIDGVPLVRGIYGAVYGLPDAVPGTIYIVSAMVRAACPDRQDLASPADLVRDASGAIVGCRALELT